SSGGSSAASAAVPVASGELGGRGGTGATALGTLSCLIRSPMRRSNGVIRMISINKPTAARPILVAGDHLLAPGLGVAGLAGVMTTVPPGPVAVDFAASPALPRISS